jgi:glycosyltransferase involved in cell wall biosynthesis
MGNTATFKRDVARWPSFSGSLNSCKTPVTVVVEPLARSTGHQSWFANNLVRGVVEAGGLPVLITFDGMHEDADLGLRAEGTQTHRVSMLIPDCLKWVFGKLTGVKLGTTAAPSGVRWPLQMYWYNQIAIAMSVLYACRAAPSASVLHILAPPSWITLGCFAIGRRSGTKAVVTAFDNFERFRGISRVVRTLCRRKALTILVQTQTIGTNWASQVGSGSVRFIPLPHENQAQMFPGGRGESRRLLGLPDSKPIVAIIGNIGPRKGYIELFRAVKDLPKTFFILLVGDTGTWTSPDPVDVAREAGWLQDTIIRKQFVPERLMPALFAAVDCVALLYREPNASSGILSLCQRYGAPVIATRDGEIGIRVREEDLGVTVDPNDTAAVAEALKLTLANTGVRQSPRDCDRSAGDEAEEVISPSWQSVGVAHRRLYEELKFAL